MNEPDDDAIRRFVEAAKSVHVLGSLAVDRLHEAPKRNKADFGRRQQIIFQATGELAGSASRRKFGRPLGCQNFRTAEDGQDFFDFVSGRREPPGGMGAGLVYSRFNHPNSEIVEDRLSVYERTENCACSRRAWRRFQPTILAFVRSGDVILHSQPLYGGTETLFAKTLAGLSIRAVGFADGDEAAVQLAAEDAMRKGPVSMIFIETPANPANGLVDIAMVRRVAETISRAQGHTPIVACDNTLLGPVFQRPSEHGADLSLHWLTKYIGGHSDDQPVARNTQHPHGES